MRIFSITALICVLHHLCLYAGHIRYAYSTCCRITARRRGKPLSDSIADLKLSVLAHERFLCQGKCLSESPPVVPDGFVPSRALRRRSLGFPGHQGQWHGASLLSPSAPSTESSQTDLLLRCPKVRCVVKLRWVGSARFSLVIRNRHLRSCTGRGHPEQWLSTETHGDCHLPRSSASRFVKFSCIPGF